MENTYLILTAFVGGFVVHQVSGIFNTWYKSWRENQIPIKTHVVDAMKEEHQKQWDFLHDKADVMDKKLSLVLARVMKSSAGSSGNYKTIIGMTEDSHSKIVDVLNEGSGKLSDEFKVLLRRFVDERPEWKEEVEKHIRDDQRDIIKENTKKGLENLEILKEVEKGCKKEVYNGVVREAKLKKEFKYDGNVEDLPLVQ